MYEASIGERAVQAISERAKANGTKVNDELALIGACRKTKGDWLKKGRNPQAYYLQQMALQGYDIYYILTGGKK